MQRLYSYLKLSSYIIQYPHSYKIDILEICCVSKETLMHNSNTIISHCICHSIVKILYIGKESIGIVRTGTEELRCTTLCTTTMHIEMYVCMYVFFIACLYELLMLIYMNCNNIYVC